MEAHPDSSACDSHKIFPRIHFPAPAFKEQCVGRLLTWYQGGAHFSTVICNRKARFHTSVAITCEIADSKRPGTPPCLSREGLQHLDHSAIGIASWRDKAGRGRGREPRLPARETTMRASMKPRVVMPLSRCSSEGMKYVCPVATPPVHATTCAPDTSCLSPPNNRQ